MTIFEPTSKPAKVWYIVIFLIIGIAGLPILIWQYRATEQTEQENKDRISYFTNQLHQSNLNVSNLQTEVARLIHDFSTNSTILPAVRLAILDDQQEKIDMQKSELQKQGALISVSLPDIAAIRAERENRRRLQELQERQEEIQRAKDEIKQQEEQAKAQIAQLQEEQKAKAEAAKKEAEETEKYLDIFDYAIRRLHTVLVIFSKDSGEKITSDFPESLPSAYHSGFVSNGHLVIGKNTMGIGTNAAWNFVVSTVNKSRLDQNYPNEAVKRGFQPIQPLPFALEIRSKRWPWLGSPILAIIPYDDCVSIKFGTARKLVINDTLNNVDYKTNLDAAITALLDSLDERWPLPTNNNPPAK